MGRENSQLDIADRHTLAVSPQPASVWTEIGEAQITQNIFGKARVRIIRKNDHIRRAMWWGAVIVIAAMAWQGWVVYQRTEQHQDETEPPPAAREAQQSVPAEPSRNDAMPAANPVMDGAATQTEIVQRPIVEKHAAAQEPRVKTAVPVHKPAAIKRPPSGTQQAKPAVQAPLEAAAKPMPPRQPGMPYMGAPRPTLPATHATNSAAAPHVTQPAASSPAAIVPLSSPVQGGEAPVPVPAADIQQPPQPGASGQ